MKPIYFMLLLVAITSGLSNHVQGQEGRFDPMDLQVYINKKIKNLRFIVLVLATSSNPLL
ncbi:hypothetical protein ACVWYN_002395 [Pedobacter sp. UYP24]